MRQGLGFGLYFSVIDWHYPQAYPISSHNADFITPEHHEFSKKQLKELLTNYGPISEVWFDMGSQTLQQSSELRALVKQLQPNCLISGRIGNDQGDFCVMGDNEYPDYSIATPWQVPASMYDETWGYRSWQKHVPVEEKVKEKLLSLVKTVARGGNYLLNIGPKGDGSVTDFEKSTLVKMGQWIKDNNEAIYGTRPLSLERLPYGELTAKENKVFLYLFQSPEKNTVVIKGLLSKISKVYALDTPGNLLKFGQSGDVLSVSLPEQFIGNEIIKVIVLEATEEISVKNSYFLELKTGVTLSNQNVTPQYSFSGIDYYSSYRSTVKYTWPVQSSSKKKITSYIYYTEEEKDRSFVLDVNGKQVPISLHDGISMTLPKQNLTWNDLYILGEARGLMGTIHGEVKNIDVIKPWAGKYWTRATEQLNTTTSEKPAGTFGNWYLLQEIMAPVPTETIVQLPLNDGVAVYLNGEELITINNPSRDASKMTTVLLQLDKGSNQLLVKYFNRFGKQLKVAVLNNCPQIIYAKALPTIEFEKGKTSKVTLQLPTEYSIHQNIDAPNVAIRIN